MNDLIEQLLFAATVDMILDPERFVVLDVAVIGAGGRFMRAWRQQSLRSEQGQ